MANQSSFLDRLVINPEYERSVGDRGFTRAETFILGWLLLLYIILCCRFSGLFVVFLGSVLGATGHTEMPVGFAIGPLTNTWSLN